MSGKTIVVGCKLPNGIILEHPSDPEKTVELIGLNRASIIGAEYAVNNVDEDFWNVWLAANKKFPAIESGAIFAAVNTNEVAVKARESKGRKTGFEGLDPKSHGVEPASKD